MVLLIDGEEQAIFKVFAKVKHPWAPAGSVPGT